jgi:hypothetical protein
MPARRLRFAVPILVAATSLALGTAAGAATAPAPGPATAPGAATANGAATAGVARAASRPWVAYAPPAAGQRLALGARRGEGADSITNYTSNNWDGYFATAANEGTDFTAVSATWTQAAVTCGGTAQQWAGFWVGMDGWWNDVVEQGGSEAQCINGSPQYNVWWEMYPFNAIQTGFAIHAGDTIKGSVTYVPSTQMFDIAVKDVTTGQTLTENTPCQSGQQGCPRTSADIISEDITNLGTGQLFPLPDYGTETYTSASVTNTSGHTGSLSDSAWQLGDVTEVSGGVTKQTTSALNSAGTSFTTTWKHQ